MKTAKMSEELSAQSTPKNSPKKPRCKPKHTYTTSTEISQLSYTTTESRAKKIKAILNNICILLKDMPIKRGHTEEAQERMQEIKNNIEEIEGIANTQDKQLEKAQRKIQILKELNTASPSIEELTENLREEITKQLQSSTKHIISKLAKITKQATHTKKAKVSTVTERIENQDQDTEKQQQTQKDNEQPEESPKDTRNPQENLIAQQPPSKKQEEGKNTEENQEDRPPQEDNREERPPQEDNREERPLQNKQQEETPPQDETKGLSQQEEEKNESYYSFLTEDAIHSEEEGECEWKTQSKRKNTKGSHCFVTITQKGSRKEGRKMKEDIEYITQQNLEEFFYTQVNDYSITLHVPSTDKAIQTKKDLQSYPEIRQNADITITKASNTKCIILYI